MAIRPSQPEIITVNSEELQTIIRDLLPSQNGFGSELQASNVITPIIDLTSAAEGSALATDLARALAFGSQTSIQITNTTTTLTTAPGFYRVIGTATMKDTGGFNRCAFEMSDGVSTKIIWSVTGPGTNVDNVSVPFDFIAWVAPGITLQGQTTNASGILAGSFRQVADSLGQTVQPSGYPL